MDLIRNYYSICSQIRVLTNQKELLRKTIITNMNENNQKDHRVENLVASKSERTKITYDVNNLKDYLLLEGFTPEEVTKSELDLKKIETLVADGRLKPMDILQFANVKEYTVLSVKESNNE